MDTTTPPLASIGIDIGKEVFHIVGFSTDGKIVLRRNARATKHRNLEEEMKRMAPALGFRRGSTNSAGNTGTRAKYLITAPALEKR